MIILSFNGEIQTHLVLIQVITKLYVNFSITLEFLIVFLHCSFLTSCKG